MEKHSTNDIDFVLMLPQEHKAFLSQIRHWSQLKMAADEGMLWLKGFHEQQLYSIDLKSIPHKELYQAKDNLLFRIGSNLPVRKLPSLLWTPIDRALPVELPDGNFNFFGFNDSQKIKVQLLPSNQEQAPFALLTGLVDLRAYIETAPAIRLQGLEWVVVKKQLALILGKPLLPIKGFTYWQRGHLLLPTGYDLELPLLANKIEQLIPSNLKQWILWNKDNQYMPIEKSNLTPLSIGSFRKTMSEVV